MEVKAIFRDIQNNILFSESDIYKFFDYLLDKYKFYIKNKKIIIDENGKYSSFLLETDKFLLTLHYWERISYCFIHISSDNFDLSILVKELLELLKPKYFKID
ncbi:MAG: hypothetical protein ACP5GJ_01140 [Nanopusillaceae archaeon]|jgi:hypothetical protein